MFLHHFARVSVSQHVCLIVRVPRRFERLLFVLVTYVTLLAFARHVTFALIVAHLKMFNTFHILVTPGIVVTLEVTVTLVLFVKLI